MSDANRDTLSRHLLWRVVGFSLVFSLLGGFIAARISHGRETAQQQQELAAVVAAYRHGLAQAAWALDDEALAAQLDGLKHFPVVQSAEVEGSGLAQHYRKGAAAPMAGVSQGLLSPGGMVSVPLMSPDGRQVVAHWRITLDEGLLREQVMAQVRYFVLLMVPQLLLMAALVFWLVKRRVTEPVEALSAHVTGLGAGALGQPAPQPALGPENELHRLARGITALQAALQGQLLHREQAAAELLSQRDRLDSLLARQQQLLDDVLYQMADGAGLLDEAGHICLANPAWVGMVAAGQGPEALQGCGGAWLQSPEWPSLVRRLDAQGGRLLSVEMALRCLDGRTLPVEASLSRIQTVVAGQPGRIQIVLRDLSQRRETERALIDAREAALETSRARGAFLANVSHEVRTPMNAIIGLTELALRTPLNPVQRDYLEKTLQASLSLLGIVDDVLDFSAVDAGKLSLANQPFSLPAVLQEVMDLLAAQAKAKGLHFRLDVPSDLPTAWRGDAMRLRQVLVNLAANAVKFTEQGEVVLQARCLPGAAAGLGRLCLAVSDTGPGISLAAQSQLFEPFTQVDASSTRRHGGTGLGLAICRQLVRLMGGQLGVRSEVGQGSRFEVVLDLPLDLSLESTRRLPTALPDAPQAEPRAAVVVPPPAGTSPLQGLRVLLVEDNALNQQVASEMLGLAGAEVIVADNGAVALQKLAVQPVDVVLMDIQMPVMDGHEATRRIRAHQTWSSLPVIAMTAHAMARDRQAALDAGMDDFITKPVDHALLVRIVAKWGHPQALPA
ncbi:response regulator [Aquabacterium sp.]|uniref:response regulator n=1 Tax=Aquabacterium sp. TaxID=1872578 RepID=UPI0025B7EE6B|nr:response regulator [Aquabacterium sp.]